MNLPTNSHQNISTEDFPKHWGFLTTGNIETDRLINQTISNIISHYVVDENIPNVYKAMKILEDKYPDCEIYAKETMGAVVEFILSFEMHEQSDFRGMKDKYFYGIN